MDEHLRSGKTPKMTEKQVVKLEVGRIEPVFQARSGRQERR